MDHPTNRGSTAKAVSQGIRDQELFPSWQNS